nr:hypothetical protein [Tanacetum cinerariifolium]
MTLTFADTHNMIAYLTKSDASEGFNQIIDLLNGSSIKYALTVNPNIYVSCIQQFWTSIAVKKVNDVMRLQALVDKKKVIITESTIRDALRLDDAEGIECLPSEEIFTELARMGYEKPSTKLTFYKAFFSSQWKFLIHTILQCRKLNFSKYIFDSLVRNVDSSTKFYMYPHFLQLMIKAQVGKGCSGVETSLFEGMIVAQEVADEDDVVPTAVEEPSIPSPTPPTPLTQPSQDQPSTSRGMMIADMDADIDVSLEGAKEVIVEKSDAEIDQSAEVQRRKSESQAQIYQINLEHANKVLSMQDDEGKPTELQEVVETEAQAKKNMMIYLRNVAGFKMDYFKGMTYDDIRLIFEKHFDSNVAFLQKTKEQMDEEDSRALKRLNESQEDKTTKKQNLDEEVEELKRHLQIVPNDEDDVYTEATPLARKVPVVDYEIYNKNNKPYFKIKRADGSHQLYLSFLSMLRNFDREDLEALWRLVKEKFATIKTKNFSDDFLLITLGAMFEKPNIQA